MRKNLCITVVLFAFGATFFCGCGASCEDVCNTMTSYPFAWPEPASECSAKCEQNVDNYSCITNCSPGSDPKGFYTCICLNCSEGACNKLVY